MKGGPTEDPDLVLILEREVVANVAQRIGERRAKLGEGRVLPHPGHQNTRQVHVGPGPAREADGVAELHPRRKADLALHPHVAPDGHVAALAVGHGVHRDGIARRHRDRGYDAARELIGADRDHHPGAAARAARFGRENAVDRDPRLIGTRLEAAGELDRVAQRLVGTELVDRRPEHLAGNRGEPAVDRDEHHVAALQPDFGRVAPLEQVVVQIEAVHQLGPAPHQDVPEGAVGGRTAGRIERREHRSRRRDLICAGPHHVAGDVDLDVAKFADRELELRRGIGSAADAGVDPAQPVVQQILDLAQRQVRDVDLAHLPDDDESLPGDGEGLRALDVTGEDEHEHVARAQPVVLVHRTGLGGLEAGGGAAEGLDPEDLEPCAPEHGDGVGQRVGPQRVGSNQPERVEHRAHRVRHDPHRIHDRERIGGLVAQHAERAHRVEGARAELRRLGGVRAHQVIVEHVFRIAGGTEACPHLIGGESRLHEPRAQLLHELGLGAEHLLGLLGARELLAGGHLCGQGGGEDGRSGQDKPRPGGQEPAQNRRGHGGRR